MTKPNNNRRSGRQPEPPPMQLKESIDVLHIHLFQFVTLGINRHRPVGNDTINIYDYQLYHLSTRAASFW